MHQKCYKSSRINDGGLPTTALLPFTTIGRSIKTGCSTIALIQSSRDKSLHSYNSLKTASFFRMMSKGSAFNMLSKFSNSS